LNKILPLVLVLSISLLIGNQVPDAFGAKPTSITLLYNGPDATIIVEDKNGNTHPTDPCGDGTPTAPCTTPVDVSDGEQFTAFFVPGAMGGDFETETHFYLGTVSTGTEFFWDNKNDGKAALHTSCSAPLVGEVSDPLLGSTLTVVSQTGGSKDGTNNCPDTPPPPPPPMIGGELLPIDTTAVLLGGTQTTASWMIPVLVAGIGIGIVIARKL